MNLFKASEPSEINSEDENPFTSSDVAFEDWVSLGIFFSLALILIAQVVSRYMLNSPLGWTEEVARYQLILLSFFGASMGFRKKTHISFIYFQTFISRHLKSIFSALLSLINSLFLVFLLITCLAIVPLIYNHEMSTLSLTISALYSLLSIAIALCLIRSLINCTSDIKCLYFIPNTHNVALVNKTERKD